MTTSTKAPKPAKLREGHYSARIRYGRGQRQRFEITARSDAEADKRAGTMQELASMLTAAEQSEHAPAFLRKLGGADPSDVAELRKLAGKLCEGKIKAAPVSRVTFRMVGTRWTSGELHREYPDHVRALADSDQNERILGTLCEADVGGGAKLGAVPIQDFTLEHAEAAMRQLPETTKRPATRRHYAQVISRVLGLAVYPLRLIPASPLPRGFLPKVGKPPAFPYLRPAEEAALLSRAAAPLAERLMFGFLCREGMRASEAGRLQFRDLDLELGAVTLTKNKTNDPRSWALDPSTVRALTLWRALRLSALADEYPDVRARSEALGGQLVFAAADGAPIELTTLAKRLRADLEAAGVKRPELFEASETTGMLRAHDLRGTFVTLALANGRTETWVADRTGHRSSAMINRYRRAARTASELGVGWLEPLDHVIPELAKAAQGGPQGGPQRRTAGQTRGSKVSRSQAKGSIAQSAELRIFNP
jgi:integrase